VRAEAAGAAAVLSLGGYVPYLAGVLFGRTSPSVLAWFIWAAEYSVLFVALAKQDPGPALWLPAAQLAGTYATFICAAVVHRDTGIDWKRAVIPVACCVVALSAWANINSPLPAILIVLAVEGYGMRITIARAWRWPQTETSWAWVMWAWAGVLGLFAAGFSAPLASYIYPAYFAVMGAAVVVAFAAGSRRLPSGRHGVYPAAMPAGTRHTTRSRPGHPV
jgi:hypothetical protein